MSKTYTRIFAHLKGKPQNGHLIANEQNKKSLAIAEKEIKEMLRGAK
jgi:hypothetical protein